MSLMLFLDGINEITHNVSYVINEISGLRGKRNIKLIISTTYDYCESYDIKPLETIKLLPFTQNRVIEYLKSKNLSCTEKIVGILNNPMILSVYSKINPHIRTDYKEKLSIFKDNNTCGELLYNYIKCKVLEKSKNLNYNENEILNIMTLLFVVAPNLAFNMYINNENSIKQKDFLKLIETCINEGNQCATYILHNNFKSMIIEMNINCDIKNIDKHNLFIYATNILNILVCSEGQIRFSHNILYEFFISLHIYNIMNINNGICDIFKQYKLSDQICEYLGHLIGDYKNEKKFLYKNILHTYIEKLANIHLKNDDYTLINIINIFRISRKNNIYGEKLSNLDFTSVILNNINFFNVDFDFCTFSQNTLLPLGHTSKIYKVIYQNSYKIISASRDNTIKLWNIYTGEIIKTLYGHTDSVTDIALNEYKKQFITSSRDGTFIIWSAETASKIKKVHAHRDWINKINYNHHKEIIATASNDGTVKIWSSNDFKLINTFICSKQRILSVCFSSDGHYLFAFTSGKTIMIWNVETCKNLSILQGHEGEVRTGIIFENDSKIISGSSNGKILVWDIETGKNLYVLQGHSNSVNDLTLTKDEETLLSASHDGTIISWNMITKEIKQRFIGHNNSVNSVCLNSDDTKFLSASGDSSIKQWNLNDGKLLNTFDGLINPIYKILLSNNGTNSYFASKDGTIAKWNITTGKLIESVQAHNSRIRSIAIINNKFIASGSDDFSIKIFDLSTLNEIATLGYHSDCVHSISYSSKTNILASASRDKTIKLWDMNKNSLICTLEAHSSTVSSIHFNKQGTKLISASWDGKVIIWDPLNMKIIMSINAHNSPAFDALILDKKSIIVSASSDKTIKIWSMINGKLIRSLKAHSSIIETLAFCPEEKYLCSGSRDNSIIVWDIDSLSPIMQLRGHTASITSIFCSHEKLYSSSRDNTIIEWDLTNGEINSIISNYKGINFNNCKIKNISFSDNTLKEILYQYS